MWLFTKRGFFSVVTMPDDRTRMQIRARCLKHLEKLLTLMPPSDRPPIQRTKDRDYLWRVMVPFTEWTRLAELLANEVDYPNFKAAIEGDRDYACVAHEVWDTMQDYQREVNRA